MCGIALHFHSLGNATPLDLARIHHRGPDSSGEWRSPDGCFWLGNTRLAIQDLSPCGAQPMHDPATGNVIVVNGEIYNQRALREELGAGIPWRGTSDTETILQCYARWGQGMLERLKGMFALAIYDAARAEVFLARDRLGIKPLYFVREADDLKLASEVRVIGDAANRPSAEAISAYLQWGASSERCLLLPGLEVLPAGHAMLIDAKGAVKVWKYWPKDGARFRSEKKSAAQKVRELLEKSVEEHLLADVPVASFLSGGIDSSILTALAAQKLERKLQTFSVGFDSAEFDESAIARQVATRYGAAHEEIRLRDEEVIESVTAAVEKMDLPSVDAINTFIVSQAVATRGIKVALSGLGGDELFGGYATFRDVPRLKFLARLPRSWRKILGPRLADLPSTSDAAELARWRRRFFTDAMIAQAGLPNELLATSEAPDLPDDFARISWAELTGYMRRMLLRDADQMSMAVSLELRVPFLDHKLVEYVLGLPAAAKTRGARPKGLLIKACRDLLPPSVYDRPKRGFVLPMRTWMLGPLQSFVERGLEETSARDLLQRAFVKQLRTQFAEGRLHWTRLWSIVVLGHYAQRHDLARAAHENSPQHAHG